MKVLYARIVFGRRDKKSTNIQSILSKLSINKSDSILKVNTFIDNWAKKQLLLQNAKIILSEIECIGAGNCVNKEQMNVLIQSLLHYR